MIARAPKVLPSDGVVWDNHACLPLRPDDRFMPELERFRNVGVNVISVNVGFADISWTEHIRVLSFMRQWLASRPETYCLISTAADVRKCRAQGKLGVVFDVEGMCPVENDLSLVQTFYELGVRWMLVAYNRNNKAGGGCLDADEGLTTLGRAIIDEMERVGMVLCLSHTGARTAAEALEYSRNPAIFSHSNPYGDVSHQRNVSDELMRTCARKGGVIGLAGIGLYIGSSVNLVESLMRQLRYTIDLVGADHVGLGLDHIFDLSEIDEFIRTNPTIFSSDVRSARDIGTIGPEAIVTIAECLARDNLSDSQIRGVLGENWMRIAERVWR